MSDQAAFNRRALALGIDWVFSDAAAHLISPRPAGIGLFLPTLILFLELSILTTLQSASAGQRILRLRVVDAGTGGPLPANRAIFRSFLICLVIPAVFTKEGRSYHDIFANSVVVKY